MGVFTYHPPPNWLKLEPRGPSQANHHHHYAHDHIVSRIFRLGIVCCPISSFHCARACPTEMSCSIPTAESQFLQRSFAPPKTRSWMESLLQFRVWYDWIIFGPWPPVLAFLIKPCFEYLRSLKRVHIIKSCTFEFRSESLGSAVRWTFRPAKTQIIIGTYYFALAKMFLVVRRRTMTIWWDPKRFLEIVKKCTNPFNELCHVGSSLWYWDPARQQTVFFIIRPPNKFANVHNIEEEDSQNIHN